MSQVPLYDTLAADYDRFVNWEARLAHELPFFLRLLGEHGVERVLDAACGTGHHAIALARQGYHVVGADLSAPMIERARENAVRQSAAQQNAMPQDAAAPGGGVTFVVAGLGELASLGETFDAVLCLGNSLPHLLTPAAVAGALVDFATVLRSGGLLIIQNRNLDRVWAERERFMSPQVHQEDGQEWIFVRFYDFRPANLTFNMLRLRRGPEGWVQDVQATELRPIFQRDLGLGLAEAGFGQVIFYGDYEGVAFDAQESGDLIAVAYR
jgi:glycine/sarcosine N-methyltransferase